MRPLLSSLALLACALPAFALEVKIDSADTDNTIWPTAVVVGRHFQYKEKEQKLVAVVDYRDDLHSNTGSATQEDTLFFRFPGVRFDPDDQTLYVETENKAVIPIGEWRKGGLGGRQVLLYTNTIVLVSKLHGHVTLTLDIDTERTPERIEKEAKKQDADQAETTTLDGLIHGKGSN